MLKLFFLQSSLALKILIPIPIVYSNLGNLVDNNSLKSNRGNFKAKNSSNCMQLAENLAAAIFSKHGCVFVIVLFCTQKYCTVNYNSKAFQTVIQLPKSYNIDFAVFTPETTRANQI